MAEQKLSFEAAMKSLETILTQLEQNDAPLEESLALFEEGTKLMRQCSALLTRAEQKVEKLTRGPDGGPLLRPFEGEE